MDIGSMLVQLFKGASMFVLTIVVFIALFVASIYLMAYLTKSQARHFYR